MMGKIRIAVGCAANEDDVESQQVLEHTLRKHSSHSLEITWMKLNRDPENFFYSDGIKGWQTKNWSTPFSAFRWAVPELYGFKGKAIYMDSDCIVQADIAELWNTKFERGKIVMAKGGAESWRFCVSMWDCKAAKFEMEAPIKAAGGLRAAGAHRLMIEHFKKYKGLVQPFKENWNCIDGEEYADLNDPDIKIIHYSSEAHQPHLKHALPRMKKLGRSHWFNGHVKPHWRPEMQELFDGLLSEAEAAGYSSSRYAEGNIFGAYNIADHKNYKSHKWAK